MASIIEIGPYHSVDPKWKRGNYSDQRDLARIAWELSLVDYPFSFAEELKELSKVFPGAEPLEILDSGCGEGYSFPDFKDIGRQLGREIRITGITMDTNHKPACLDNEVDILVIGSVKRYFRRVRYLPKYHFILDYNGAGASDVDGQELLKSGRVTLSIYNRILHPRGIALMTYKGDIRQFRRQGMEIISGVGRYGYIFARKFAETK
ncbi:hypothetical protein KKE03_00700 [Patescibacteria group bacterium]|nr:hypothetical protein [Patescibacteria group bacterium]